MSQSQNVNGKVQQFIEAVKPYCAYEPKWSDREVSVILKSAVVNDRKKYGEIDMLATGLGATRTVMPPGFRILLTDSVENDRVLLRLHVSDIEGGGPQPRTTIKPDDPETVALFENIKAKGQLDPIKVYPSPTTLGKYRIYEGHRRHMVIFTMLMKPEILAICEKRTEQQAYEDAFTFNSSRQNLSAYDQGHYITEVLMKLFPEVYRTQDDIGKRLSLEQSTVSKILTAYRELETQVAKLSSENMTRVINLPERTINKISKAPEALKPAIFEQVVEKDLSVRETEKLVKEVNAVPEAEVDDKTVEDKVSALFDEADKTLSKAERANNKLLEGAVVLTPEPIVLEVICRAGESKITVEQLKVFLSFYLQKLYDFAKASGKLDQVFEDAQLEAAKW